MPSFKCFKYNYIKHYRTIILNYLYNDPWQLIVVCIFQKENKRSPGITGSRSQSQHWYLWMSLTQGVCMPHINPIPCTGQMLQLKLEFADRCTGTQTDLKQICPWSYNWGWGDIRKYKLFNLKNVWKDHSSEVLSTRLECFLLWHRYNPITSNFMTVQSAYKQPVKVE